MDPEGGLSCSDTVGRMPHAFLVDRRRRDLLTTEVDASVGDREDILLIDPESPQQSTSTATSASVSSRCCQC